MILRGSLRPEVNAELLAFHGELDATAAPDLATRIAEVLQSATGALVLDLANCIFIDSAGLTVLVDAARDLAAEDRRMVLVTQSSQPRQIVELAGVDELTPICWSQEEAAALLADEPG